MPKKLKLFPIVDTLGSISTIQPLFPLRSSRDNSPHPNWLHKKEKEKHKKKRLSAPPFLHFRPRVLPPRRYFGRIEGRTDSARFKIHFGVNGELAKGGGESAHSTKFNLSRLFDTRETLFRDRIGSSPPLPRRFSASADVDSRRIPDNIVPTLSALLLPFFRPRSFMRISRAGSRKIEIYSFIRVEKNFL